MSKEQRESLFQNLDLHFQKYNETYIYCANDLAEKVVIPFCKKRKIKIKGVIDKNKFGRKIAGFTVESPDILQNANNELILICSSVFANEIISSIVKSNYNVNPQAVKFD